MPKPKRRKKLSYEQRSRKLKEYRANLPDEKKEQIKEYNRVRSSLARARETPMEREKRLQKCRDLARRRRSKRKSQSEREMRKLGLLTVRAQIPPANFKKQLFNIRTQLINNHENNQGNNQNSLTSNAVKALVKNIRAIPVNSQKDRQVFPDHLPFAYRPIPYPLPSGTSGMPEVSMSPVGMLPASSHSMNIQPFNMPSMSMDDDYDDMATVCPIECNVDIAPEPVEKFKPSVNSTPRQKDHAIIKNIGADVVLKKKVVNRGPSEDVRIQNVHNGGNYDWNGYASVCPIECNVDIREPETSHQPVVEPSKETMKRNSLLDNLKQMGTHVIIRKKGDNKGFMIRKGLTMEPVSRVLPVECNVDIKPVESRFKSSEITIVKPNKDNNFKRFGSQIMLQKVVKPVPEKNYESPEEGYEDYDVTCPIECNVDISESS